MSTPLYNLKGPAEPVLMPLRWEQVKDGPPPKPGNIVRLLRGATRARHVLPGDMTKHLMPRFGVILGVIRSVDWPTNRVVVQTYGPYPGRASMPMVIK